METQDVITSTLAREFLAGGLPVDCPIIALHGHLGQFAGGYLPTAALDRILRSMDRSGVTRMACAHHVAMMYDVELGNRLMQDAIDAHPDRLLGYWVVNPNHPGILERDVARFDRARGFIGFKLWADYHLVPIDSPKYAVALEYANEHQLIQLVHTWGGSEFDRPELVGEIAVKYPRATFLMAHSGHGSFEAAAGIARDLPNVYLELSSVPNPADFSQMPGGTLMPGGTHRSSPQISGIIEYLTGVAGSQKVVFGSDLPWYSIDYHLGAVLFARISDEERRDVLYRNAERLLGGR